jgi:hypothetical protein
MLRDRIQPILAVVFMGIACGLVGAALAFLVAGLSPKTYAASVSLFAPTQADTFADVADSSSVLQSVVSELKLAVTPQELAGQVSATASKTSSLLTIEALDRDPQRAAAIANATATALVKMAPTISGASAAALSLIGADLATVETQITRTETAIDGLSGLASQTPAQTAELISLQTQLGTFLPIRSSLLTLQLSYSQTVLTVLSQADVPTRAEAPQPLAAGVLGGLAGLAVGITAGLLVIYMRRQV